jgi:uncharacterized DUF497 family protein
MARAPDKASLSREPRRGRAGTLGDCLQRSFIAFAALGEFLKHVTARNAAVIERRHLDPPATLKLRHLA